MPAISSLMKRLGYAKLSRYGLVLTPEGRVLSMRPAVLDDGLGGRIVGWEDGDLAAMELDKWEPARPAPKAAVATRVAAPRPPLPTRPVPVVPAAVPAMVVRETSLPITVAPVPAIKQTVYQPPAPVPAPVKVAAEPVAEEDDWEWTIAIARARAAAEESELAAAQPPPAPPKFVAAKTLPIAKIAEKDPIASGEWPKTEPLGEIDYNDYTSPMHEVVRVAKLANTPRVVLPAKATPPQAMPVVVPVIAQPVPAQQRDYPRAKSPVTVIPIPKLPTMANPRPVQPVVRAAPVEQPRRLAKGTGPYLPKTAPMAIVPAPERDEDTVPHMVLPPVARTVALPSVVKRASRG